MKKKLKKEICEKNDISGKYILHKNRRKIDFAKKIGSCKKMISEKKDFVEKKKEEK